MEPPRLIKQIAKRVIKATPLLRRHIMSSSDHRLLSGVDEARRVAESSGGWLAKRTVMRQERAYKGLITAMKRGEPRLDFKVAAEAVIATGLVHPNVIETGCGSGDYSEVFAELVPGGIRYTGADFSDAMIARARTRYPGATFEVADATSLPYRDGTFDIVFNGVSLMHIIGYPAAIREAARVAARYCIMHTVPVFDDDHETTFLSKYAYGAPVVEIIFGKAELMALCHEAGLRLVRTWLCIPYDMVDVTGHHSWTETYLFSKDRQA
jgi:SAM-dependent methyltransferase